MRLAWRRAPGLAPGFAVGLLLGAMLAGCGQSAPGRFYVLTSNAAPARPPTASRKIVALGRIDLPGALDRPQIARRRGANEIAYSEEERWAAPLGEMLRRVLADDLAARLPGAVVLGEAGSATPSAVTIALEVARFDADERGQVTLRARWTALGQDGTPRGAPQEIGIVDPGSGTAAASIAAAMSRTVSELAGHIARGLR